MPAKKRPRNPLKRYTCSVFPKWGKAPEEFTGSGDEDITGAGGGVLSFSDGKLVRSIDAPLCRKLTVEDSVHRLTILGRLGLSINSGAYAEEIPPAVRELLSNPDLSLMACQLLEAIHAGDAEIFRRIAAIIANPDASTDKLPHSTTQLVGLAVHTAASERGGIPTREEVAHVLRRTKDEGGQARFTTTHESDKMQTMLESVGFGWLPHSRQGSHLRRKLPK